MSIEIDIPGPTETACVDLVVEAFVDIPNPTVAAVVKAATVANPDRTSLTTVAPS